MNPNSRYLDFDPRKLPKEYLEAIGLVCTCYAQTEDHVQMAIAGLLGVDIEMGWGVSTHMSAPLRKSVIQSLSEIKFANLDDIETLDKLLEKVDQAASKRNHVVHQVWCRDVQTGEVLRVNTNAKARVSVEHKPISLEDLRAEAIFVYEAGIELFHFLTTKNLVPALPPRERSRLDKRKAIKHKRRTK